MIENLEMMLCRNQRGIEATKDLIKEEYKLALDLKPTKYKNMALESMDKTLTELYKLYDKREDLYQQKCGTKPFGVL